MTTGCDRTAGGAAVLAHQLRDGLLQDLLAVSMLMEEARARVARRDGAGADELLGDAGDALRRDIADMRGLIRRLCVIDAGIAVRRGAEDDAEAPAD